MAEEIQRQNRQQRDRRQHKIVVPQDAPRGAVLRQLTRLKTRYDTRIFGSDGTDDQPTGQLIERGNRGGDEHDPLHRALRNVTPRPPPSRRFFVGRLGERWSLRDRPAVVFSMLDWQFTHNRANGTASSRAFMIGRSHMPHNPYVF